MQLLNCYFTKKQNNKKDIIKFIGSSGFKIALILLIKVKVI